MEKMAPGIASPHTLLYGVEVKFYSSRLQLTDKLETTTRQPLRDRRRRGNHSRPDAELGLGRDRGKGDIA